MRWRYIGPEGNRLAAVAGVPGDPLDYYVGAASGGIWKTFDAGRHWEPVFDDQTVSSIGALAVAPSDPNVVWAGTGEAFSRSHISVGEGIFKSTDAGKSWTRMGLEKTGRIARVIIDPSNPGIVLACASRPRVRPAARARRLPHGRRRPDLEPHALRRREHRLLRPRDQSEQSTHAVCPDVAARNPHRVTRERLTR